MRQPINFEARASLHDLARTSLEEAREALARFMEAARQAYELLSRSGHAYQRPEFRGGHYACFHTGPSATADMTTAGLSRSMREFSLSRPSWRAFSSWLAGCSTASCRLWTAARR